jgi:hypothetical protein
MEKEQLRELIKKREQLDKEIRESQWEGSIKWFKELSLLGKIMLIVVCLLVAIPVGMFLGVIIGSILDKLYESCLAV